MHSELKRDHCGSFDISFTYIQETIFSHYPVLRRFWSLTCLYDFNCRGVKSSTVSLTMAIMAGSFAFDGEWATAEVASAHPHGGPMVHDARIIDGVTFSSLSVQVSGCVIYLWLSDRPNLGESIHHDNGTIPCARSWIETKPLHMWSTNAFWLWTPIVDNCRAYILSPCWNFFTMCLIGSADHVSVEVCGEHSKAQLFHLCEEIT